MTESATIKYLIRSCPFCGNPHPELSDFNEALGLEPVGDSGFVVVCSTPSGCGASSSWTKTAEETISKWNNRNHRSNQGEVYEQAPHVVSAPAAIQRDPQAERQEAQVLVEGV